MYYEILAVRFSHSSTRMVIAPWSCTNYKSKVHSLLESKMKRAWCIPHFLLLACGLGGKWVCWAARESHTEYQIVRNWRNNVGTKWGNWCWCVWSCEKVPSNRWTHDCVGIESPQSSGIKDEACVMHPTISLMDLSTNYLIWFPGWFASSYPFHIQLEPTYPQYAQLQESLALIHSD